MSPRIRVGIQYGGAVLCVVGATLVRGLLAPLLGPEHPFAVYYAAVMVAAGCGGPGPALLALLLGVVAADFFFIAPLGLVLIVGIGNLVGTGLYLAVGAVIITMSQSLRAARALAERNAAEAASGRAALAEADRHKDAFLAMLAHELRTPLASIQNATALLRRSRDDADQRDAIGLIEHQVRLGVRLVDDLLDLTRIARGGLALRLQRIDLVPTIQRAVAAVRPMIEERGHRLRAESPAEPIWAKADAARVEQVVTNLLTNAAKYTEPGGSIELRVCREGPEAVVRVRDDGLGNPRSSSTVSSTCTCSPTPHGAAWGSAWRWSGGWSRRTGGQSPRTAKARAGAANSWSPSRPPRRPRHPERGCRAHPTTC
jgi:signal transduction histidine kinase